MLEQISPEVRSLVAVFCAHLVSRWVDVAALRNQVGQCRSSLELLGRRFSALLLRLDREPQLKTQQQIADAKVK